MKETKRISDALHEQDGKSKGTVVCRSWDEFDKVVKKYNGDLLSPGGAAARLKVSRVYIHQLEKEGKITVYRIWDKDMLWDSLPLWMRALMPRKVVYVFIPTVEVERLKKEMIKRAETKIKQLKAK